MEMTKLYKVKQNILINHAT